MYKSVIFDFDGTICDTGEGIKKSAKYALDAFNIPSDDWQTLDCFIGPPLLVTFQEQFNQSAADADLLVQKFRERYTNTGIYECELYNGIKQLLINLKVDGIKIGIASSKPQVFVETLLNKFAIAKYFDSVCATSFAADCESKQNIIARCLKELETEPKDALMVGDRFYDIDGAKADMVDGAGALWGYGSKFEFIECGAKYIVDKVEDIESIALGLYERTEKVNGIYNGRVLTMHVDDVLLCNDQKANRECVDHPGGVAVIGVTDDDMVVLVRQFCIRIRKQFMKFPQVSLKRARTRLRQASASLRKKPEALPRNIFRSARFIRHPATQTKLSDFMLQRTLHLKSKISMTTSFCRFAKSALTSLSGEL